MKVKRRLTYKLVPSRSQAREMERQRILHQQLYNAALQERRDAWTKSGISIRRSDQEKSLKEFKHALEEWRNIHTHTMQVTLKRLDLAFQSFFRRLDGAGKPGFPRFQARDRFNGWGYKQHKNGFWFEPGSGWKHGYLKLSGIGRMQVRGRARTPGEVKTCDIIRKFDGWYASIVVETECQTRDAPQPGIAGMDWGVESFATLACDDGSMNVIENDRFLAREASAIRDDARAFAREHRGRRRTRRLQREKSRISRRMRKIANRRKDRAHKLSARLVRDHAMIVTEDLTIRNMTASARGTILAPGRNVAQKAGLNRSILDTAPAMFLNMLKYKAEEAGTGLLLVNTRKHKPSQTCPGCGAVAKKMLSQRVHTCASCGFTCGRDEAAALNLLKIGQDMARDRAGIPPP